MLARLRSFLLKIPVLVALALVAAWFLFAWFGFDPLVKWAAPKFIADKSRHQLSIAEARFDPFALSVSVKGLKLAEPDGKPLLAFDDLFVDFEAASLFKWAWTFDAIRLTGPRARMELLADGRLNWSGLIEAFKDEEEKPEKPLPRLLIRRIVLERGWVDVADRKVDFETSLSPLALTLTDLSTLPEDKGAHTLAATTEIGARVRWKGDVTLKPVLATGELAVDSLPLAKAWPYLEARLNMAPPEGVAALGLKYKVGWADKKLSLNVDDLSLAVDRLALRGAPAAAPAVTLERLALSGGRFDLGRRSLEIGEIALNGGRVALTRAADGRIDLQDWFVAPAQGQVASAPDITGKAPAPAAPAKAGQAPAAAQPAAAEPAWRIGLGRFSLDQMAIHFTDLGFVKPLTAEVGNLKIGFKAHAELGAGEPKAELEDLGIDVSGIRLLSGEVKDPVLVLGGVVVEEGRVDLAGQNATLGRIALLNGQMEVVRDARGQRPLLEALRRQPAKAVAERVVVVAARKTLDWRYRVGEVEANGFRLALRDESITPFVKFTVQDIQASAKGLSEDLKAAIPVRMGFRVLEGGRFEASGKVAPGRPTADLKLNLVDLALSPVQPYLAKASNLLLAGGRASTAGQVRYGDGKVRYTGGFHVDDLLINEISTGERFLAWKSVSSNDLAATPTSLDIGELRLDRPGLKLVIFKDKSTSLAKAFQKGAPTAEAGNKEAKAPASPWDEDDAAVSTAVTPAVAKAAEAKPAPAGQASAGGKADPAFRVNIERVRIDQGEMDFADLSLALPFGTRIHEFKGNINGISNKPGGQAELELDGRVDEFGLARAVGQLDTFDPTGFMDIKVVFQNVEMTRLTPYTATFVGRKIESGKLSLDLEYKLKQRQMQGENKIVMNKLTLGERVESPTAKNLPLDLAIAILQDSNGVIDLDLPVSGSLDDPKFSYGRIIWKAIGNIITKIVTAPFRALGALFGGGGEKLEKVAFEAGEAGLTPPEKEKFKQIAQILNKRPGLALTVQGAWSAEIDRPALKERQLRRAVAEKMGVKLAADEDPGPISTANPKARAGLEALYAARFGETQWKMLNGKWLQANPDKKQESAGGKMVSRLKNLFKPEEPLSAEDLGQLKGADLHALLYQRLLDKETVDDAVLVKLAQSRGQAVVDALVALGTPADRVKSGAAAKFEGEGREVPAKLELGVAKR
ncbi:MAG: hypothetical protein FD187_934 [bacterium]|nr:MAG: hypothetical protein FD142_65 [bacterium]KAF0149640.1 MAG: hypothetical protein FD187_934 [bacterium]KAF0169306.1 MAG: hypothetical protein FD158_496 [bacterium]TXT16791.1 MAG: hypothetical protein FD132_2699 [bacterium]